MTPGEIPEFIFTGAVVAVRGREETITCLSLERPLVNGRPAKEDVLYLKFKSGLEREYDPAEVCEIPGRAPSFIERGARLFCKAAPEANAQGQGYSTELTGVWEISSYRFKAEKLHVVLRRPTGKDGGDLYLSRAFNARTMFPVSKEGPLPVETPPYQLENALPVRKKPVGFKPKAD